MMKHHNYNLQVEWTGNTGEGTHNYRSYLRDHVISSAGKPRIDGSSDPSFRGDAARYNPEELLVASLSACHMLWYLHFCAVHHVTVVQYSDCTAGVMAEREDGSGVFTKVTLRPAVVITPDSDLEKALSLHELAHRSCFIANSVNFPVLLEPSVETLSSAG